MQKQEFFVPDPLPGLNEIIAANAQAAIPLQLGSKVLTQLARVLLGVAKNGR